MVDKIEEQEENMNDEYQFSDMNDMSSDMDQSGSGTSSDTGSQSPSPGLNNPMIVKAIIIVVAVLIAMIVYKFISSVSSSKTTSLPPAPAPMQSQIPIPQPIINQPPQIVTPSKPSPEVSQKLSALEVTQQTLGTDMNNLNNQVVTLSSNVADINTKIDQLNQTINSLASQIAEQSQQIAILTAHAKSHERHVRVIKHPKNRVGKLVYYIQAVIPGRAWLISSAGATMTVRDGSSIPGYGVVKLIEPSEGRILTSSGRVIKFSQLDS